MQSERKKSVLVVGGSGGIGSSVVRRFVAKGYAVAFTYNTDGATADLLLSEFHGLPITAIKCDVRSDSDIVSAVGKAAYEYGGVDVLVNCVGKARYRLVSEEVSEEAEELFRVNVLSHVLFAREALKRGGMLENMWGRIINVSSVWGRYGASNEAVYSATKSAVEGFTRALAKEVAPHGITVNAVSVGVCKTRMTTEELDADTVDDLIARTPLGRLVEPTEVADLCVYLASESSAMVSGEVIGIDGLFHG